MNIFKTIRDTLITELHILATELECEFNTDSITLEQPRDLSHGDMATNAAMVLCKQAKMPPRALAEKIAEKISAFDDVQSVEIAGPGFINIRINNTVLQSVLENILQHPKDFGRSDIGQNVPVNVEYVSANPTGPMHIGHARGAVYGDVLALLLKKVGYDVTREYYINDAGAQVDVLARSVFLRYKEANGENITIPEGLYPGDYLKAAGQALKDTYGDSLMTLPESQWLEDIRAFAIDAMMDMIRNDLKALGVEHDIFSSEKALVEQGKVEQAIKILTDKGDVYQGVLEPPKGKLPENWEARPQILFKSMQYGDDTDRPLQKSDGGYTYFASDIAYHFDKYNRGFAKQINVWGADHGGYVKRMQGALQAVTENKGSLHVELCQLVKLMDNGTVLKMSKRSGTFVTLRELVDEVGADVVRFFMMTRKADAPLDFDLAVVKEASKENPIFYVQYAYARCCSVLRQAEESGFIVDPKNAHAVNEQEFLNIVKELALYPRTLESAAENFEPHRVAFYLMNLAARFHELWAKGGNDATLRFILENNTDTTQARLTVVQSIKNVIESGLEIFAIPPREVL